VHAIIEMAEARQQSSGAAEQDARS
jgi:hypothetical protein